MTVTLNAQKIRRALTTATEQGNDAAVRGLTAKLRELTAWVPLPFQVPPDGDWSVWLAMAGRGSGKSAGGTAAFDAHMQGPPCDPRVPGGHRGRIIAPTFGDAVAASVNGPSGVRAHNPSVQMVGTKEGTLLYWPNGASARLFGAYTASDVDRLRAGGNACFDLFDELAAFRHLEDAWDQAAFGRRLGSNPRVIVTTTPRNREKIRELVRTAHWYTLAGWLHKQGKLEGWVPSRRESIALSTATTADNPYLAEDVRAALYEAYAGTRIGEQELLGRLVEELGAFFSAAWYGYRDGYLTGPRVSTVRYWDLAATPPGPSNPDPDWTVGARVSFEPGAGEPLTLPSGETIRTGLFNVDDIVRLRGTAGEVEAAVLRAVEQDGVGVEVGIEQDPGQAGKPVYVGEMILMADGTRKPLGEIIVGDVVISGSGRPRAVTAVHEQGEIPTVRIVTDQGRSAIFGVEHPILTPAGWVNAGDLRPGPISGNGRTTGEVVALLTEPQIAATSTLTPEAARLIGYFIGDGACGPNGSSILASIVALDPAEVADLKHCVSTLGFSMYESKSRAGTWHMKGGVRPWLRQVGIAGTMSYSKRVPECVLTGPPSIVAEFLGAYFACDGHLDRARSTAEFYSVSPDLLTDVQHLLLRLGVVSAVREKAGRYRGERHRSYRLTLRGSADAWARFAERVPIYHSEKAAALGELAPVRRQFDSLYVPDTVVEVVPSGLQECRCLTVAEDHTFTVSDLVVHNSQVAHYKQLIGARARVRGWLPTGPKEVRAQLEAAAAEQGRVTLTRAEWNRQYLDEHEEFPDGGHDDVVDGCSGAFAVLSGRGREASSAQAAGARIPTIGRVSTVGRRRT